MLNELVGQFLKSSDGGALLQQLQAKGLTEQQATHAVTATAEGAAEHGNAGGLDLASLAGGLLGGGGGGLGAMVGAFGGGAPAAGAAPARVRAAHAWRAGTVRGAKREHCVPRAERAATLRAHALMQLTKICMVPS